MVVANATEMAADTPWRPRPDQWGYVKKVHAAAAKDDGGSLAGPPTRRVTTESWLAVNGMRAAAMSGEKLKIRAVSGLERSATPRSDYPYLATLPTKPEALLTFVYMNADQPLPRDAAAFSMIEVMMRDRVPPPKLRAAMYGALTKIPDVRFDEDVVDAAGRHGVSLYRVDEGYVRTDIIINRRTYYMGYRSMAVRNHTARGLDGVSSSKKGQILGWSATLRAAIVDKAGQR